MTKLSRRSLTILAAVAIPAALLVIAPSGAVAKKGKKVVEINLEGPISLKRDPGYSPKEHVCCFPTFTPTIQIHAQFGGGVVCQPRPLGGVVEGEVCRRKKGPSVEVTEYGLWGPCSVREYTSGMGGAEITLKPKKNGTFSGTHTESEVTEVGSDSPDTSTFTTVTSTFTVSGRILGKRTASGTVRSVGVLPPRQPAGTYAEGTCDTGPVTWTASRVKELSKLKQSLSPPDMVYPAGL